MSETTMKKWSSKGSIGGCKDLPGNDKVPEAIEDGAGDGGLMTS